MDKQERFPLSQPAQALLVAVIAAGLGFLIPPAMPVLGVLFVGAGLVFSRRSADPNARIFWRIITWAGVLFLLVTLFILLTQVMVG